MATLFSAAGSAFFASPSVPADASFGFAAAAAPVPSVARVERGTAAAVAAGSGVGEGSARLAGAKPERLPSAGGVLGGFGLETPAAVAAAGAARVAMAAGGAAPAGG